MPVFPSAVTMRHWSFDDPAAAPQDSRLEPFRRVRNEIAELIYHFCIEDAHMLPTTLNCYRC